MKLNTKIAIIAGMDLLLIIMGLVFGLYWLSIICGIIAVLGTVFGFYYAKYLKNHLRIIKTPPDPLTFENGEKVKTEADWELRRKEIKEIILREEYGHMPPRPDVLRITTIREGKRANGGIEKLLLFSIIPDKNQMDKMVNFTVWVFAPEGEGPYPALIKISPDGTGSQEPIADYIVERGYVFACFDHIELDLDTFGNNVDGHAQLAYPDYDWGTLAVWAWGAMRVMDYLSQEDWIICSDSIPNVDKNKVIVTGHSRRGKTALLAAAMDERFAIAAPNGSGCGGAGSFLILGPGSQGVGSIASKKRYESWFHKNMRKYADNEKTMNFDQHFMRCLVAPRSVISHDGFGDLWANPIGTQAMYEAAKPVFELFGVPENNAINFREGGHAFKKEDFDVFLDYADKQFYGKNSETDFYMEPFEIKLDKTPKI